jgi:hypothetical protein
MRKRRKYSLFEKQDTRWVRISKTSYFKEVAVRVYQTELLSPFIGGGCIEIKGERSLRPVMPEYENVEVLV